MSQLSFIELTEGASAAVAASDELLGLFNRLFGAPEQGKTNIAKESTETATPKPKSTLRSIAGSIRRGGHKEEKGLHRTFSTTSAPESRAPSRSATPNQMYADSPISITVTNEDGTTSGRFKRGRQALESRLKRHGKKDSTASDQAELLRNLSVRDRQAYVNGDTGELTALPSANPVGNGRAVSPALVASAHPDSGNQPRQDLEVTHSGPHDQWPPPVGHDEHPPVQDIRLPAAHPAVAQGPELRFPSLQERRHKIGLLVDIWLFIADLYMRAELLDDASGAIVEASRQAESLEVEIAAQSSSAKQFASRGWGGAKSIDELMADIWSAVSLDYC